MNKKAFVETTLIVVASTVVFGIIAVKSANFNFNTSEGKVKQAKVSLTELTKNNGRTIWCKMQGKKDCE